MNELKDWTCDFAIDKKTPLTVGQKFSVQCTGTTPIENTNGEILIFPNDDKVKYNFVLLKSEIKNPNELVLIATSWKTGNHSYKRYSVVVNNSVIDLNGPNVKVKSLLQKNTKMNPPIGPIGAKFPPYVKYVGALFFILLFVYVIYWFKKNKKYDLALIKLYSLKTSLSPFYELNKKLRAMEVRLSKLNEANPDAMVLKDQLSQLKEAILNYVSLSISEPLFIYKHPKQIKVLGSHLPKDKRQKVVTAFVELQKEVFNLGRDLKSQKNLDVLVKDFFILIEQAKEFSEIFLDAKGWNEDGDERYA